MWKSGLQRRETDITLIRTIFLQGAGYHDGTRARTGTAIT